MGNGPVTSSDRLSSRLGILEASAAAVFRRGPNSLVNISVYGFGLTGLWTSTTLVILQFRVLDIVGEENKATWVGAISVMGLIVAAIVQPIIGRISDRSRFTMGRRLPFIVSGSIGLLISTVLLGAANTIPLLVAVYVLMQLFGNVAQSAANALLLDHVTDDRRGAAAGALNLSRAIGAGVVTMLVLFLLVNYDPVTSRGWLWAALAVISGIVLVTTTWTFFALRPPGRAGAENERPDSPQPDSAGESEPEIDEALFRRNFLWFLAALALGLGTVSTLGRFALFFLSDVVGLENPAAGGQWIAVGVGFVVAATVYPAGALSDRVGRMPVLFGAGIVGAIASAGLTLNSGFAYVFVDGMVFGVAAGTFLSVTWALANDLVPKHRAARTLGYTSFSLLLGGALPLGAGFMIDGLNRRSENLGYDVLLIAVAAIFLVVPLILTRIHLPQRTVTVADIPAPAPREQGAS